MAEQDELLTGTIDDYLIGLADGLQKAQRQLAQISVALQPGEAPVTYQIPRVDFELKLSFEITNSSSDGSDGPSTPGGKVLRFRPPGTQRGGATTTTAEAVSTIRGALVAVPTLGGKPPPVIRTTLRQIDRNKLEVRVLVTSAAGERLSGVDVQFNVDRELSKRLSPVANAQLPPAAFDSSTTGFDNSSFDQAPDLREGTTFWDGLVTTDAQGFAVGVLNVDPLEALGTSVAAVVDVLGQTETIVFKVA